MSTIKIKQAKPVHTPVQLAAMLRNAMSDMIDAGAVDANGNVLDATLAAEMLTGAIKPPFAKPSRTRRKLRLVKSEPVNIVATLGPVEVIDTAPAVERRDSGTLVIADEARYVAAVSALAPSDECPDCAEDPPSECLTNEEVALDLAVDTLGSESATTQQKVEAYSKIHGAPVGKPARLAMVAKYPDAFAGVSDHTLKSAVRRMLIAAA